MKTQSQRSLPGAHAPTVAAGKGFTLTELLVVIAIIAVLASGIFVAVRRGLEKSRAVSCSSNLRSLYALSVAFSDENGANIPLQNEFLAKGNRGGGYRPWNSYLYDYAKDNGLDYQKIMRCPSDKDTVSNRTAAQLKALDYPSYGINANFGWPDYDRLDRPTRLVNVERAGEIIYFGESAHRGQMTSFGTPKARGSALITPYNANDQLHGRHDGKAMVVFLDGHIEALGNLDDPNGVNSRNKDVSGKYWLIDR